MTIKRCIDCERARRIFRRGRCHRCYWEFRKTNAPLPVGGAHHVGLQYGSLRQIAKEVGISHVTVKRAIDMGRLWQDELNAWHYTPGVPGRPRK